MSLFSYVEKINNAKLEIDLYKYLDNDESYEIKTLNKSYLENKDTLSEISNLRNKYNKSFRNRIDSNIDSTIDWLKNDFFMKNEKILFLIFDKKKNLVGHIGLHIHNENKIEIDNVIKNENTEIFKMYKILKAIESFAFLELKINIIILKVLESNNKAFNFYKKNGYFIVSEKNQKLSTKDGHVKLIDTDNEKNIDDKLFTMKKIKISAVIPCYNSENSITILLNSLIEKFEFLNLNYEIIIVDDKSPDKTIQKIKEYINISKIQNISIFKSEENLGQITSTIFGISKTSGDFILTIDDDLQHNPDDFTEMLDVIIDQEVDAVVGFWNVDETLFRNVTSVLFNFISNLVKFKSLKYRNTAFRLFRGKLRNEFLEYFINKNWIDLRFITKSISQIKTEHHPPYGREFTKTKYRLNVALKYLFFDTYLFEIVFIILSLFSYVYFLIVSLLFFLYKLIKKKNLARFRRELFLKSSNYTKA